MAAAAAQASTARTSTATSPTSRTSERRRYGGALTAGLFLQEFVGDDTRGCTSTSPARRVRDEEDGYTAKGGTGFGVRTLVETVLEFAEPD